MKRTDGFDARRLRPRQPRSWGSRLASAFALLLILAGILLAGSGAAALFSHHEWVVDVALDREAAITLLVLGLILLALGMLIRRRVKRRLRGPAGLSMSPRLKGKH
ncbi:hypothetical protein JNA64_03965 [Pseudomonas stutzeri]|uniref:hypothetical protein n=1 Tax=Stutzerimonas stutzeri TaxID=316 RepID=UPI001F52889B|nr:hypothetical protein [Stutzerimonas stutzeri]MCI0916309.1 hypothetical protein [Stutzerimonas stutzeri]